MDDNVSTDPGDPIIHGPHGSGTGYTDTGSPAPGLILYYFVNSTDGATAESAD